MKLLPVLSNYLMEQNNVASSYCTLFLFRNNDQKLTSHDKTMQPPTQKQQQLQQQPHQIYNMKEQQELRQRRARIIRETRQHREEDKRVKDFVTQSTKQSSAHFMQMFLVVVTALLIFISVLLQYTKPQFFQRLFRRRNVPPFYIATKYPNSVILDRDLPRFYQAYSIATPDNVEAQEAVKKVVRSRTQIKRRLGNLKAIVKAWDIANIQNLVQRGLCGDDFTQAYQGGSDLRKDTLLMWCLVATRVVEGYFYDTVEMIDSALFLTRKRGMVVKRRQPTGLEMDGHGGALSTSFYLHPRHNNTLIEWIPSKALAMAISTPENDVASPLEAREMLERYLFDLVISQGNEEDYLVLDEVCQRDQPDRAIGMDCPNGSDSDCCFFVVPERYGGRFQVNNDNDD
jgi:hypothetical protein